MSQVVEQGSIVQQTSHNQRGVRSTRWRVRAVKSVRIAPLSAPSTDAERCTSFSPTLLMRLRAISIGYTRFRS
jgi:hypothetical protein